MSQSTLTCLTHTNSTLSPTLPLLFTFHFPFISFLSIFSKQNMAHNTTNRPKLTTSDHYLKTSTSLDSTLKKQPKSYPQDTYVPSNTIEKISNQFSQLYANHKNLKSTLKDTSSHSLNSLDNHLKVKLCTNSPCKTLTKSKSQHEEIKKVSSHKGKEFNKEEQSLTLSKHISGRRKSFSSSKNELADFFSCNGVKVVAVDMPPFMQIHAVNCARKTHDSLEKFTSKALALSLKKEFDGVYGPAWHCIVGTSFGSFVTHSVGGFIYFSMDHKIYVLLFKTTVLKTESS